jgi:hypothetical protein
MTSGTRLPAVRRLTRISAVASHIAPDIARAGANRSCVARRRTHSRQLIHKRGGRWHHQLGALLYESGQNPGQPRIVVSSIASAEHTPLSHVSSPFRKCAELTQVQAFAALRDSPAPSPPTDSDTEVADSSRIFTPSWSRERWNYGLFSWEVIDVCRGLRRFFSVFRVQDSVVSSPDLEA